MGALSRSPSPMTMEPRILSRLSSSRIDSTATWSEYFRFPYPIVRAAAMAAFSVTRRNPISRLDSMSILDFVFSRGTLTEVTISSMRIAAVTALIVLSAAYAVLIAVNVSHAAGGPDESGYMNEARLLASGHARIEIEPLRVLKIDRSYAWTFTPYGF